MKQRSSNFQADALASILEEGRDHSSKKVEIITTKPRLDEIPNNNSSFGIVTSSDLLLNKYSDMDLTNFEDENEENDETTCNF